MAENEGRDIDGAGGVRSVIRVSRILQAFRVNPGDLGVSEISRMTGIHKSTVSRLLTALTEESLVALNPSTGRYRLGPGIIALAASAEPDLFLRAAVHPSLVQLNANTGETVTLSVLEGFEALVVDAVAGPRALRVAVVPGTRNPLHATAAGKCLLAFASPELLDDYLARGVLDPLTNQTIVNPDELRREIACVRQRGYATNDEEFEVGVGAISAPTRGFDGRLVSVINISWPSALVTAPDRGRFISLLLDATRHVSGLFGYAPRADDPSQASRFP
jgi:DNA-binding IclR family transcriptional regulator